jgi:hypothetical protein
MSFRRCALSLRLGLVLVLLSALPAAAAGSLPQAPPQPAHAWLAAGTSCAASIAQPLIDPIQSFEVSPFASEPLSTRPSCPRGQIYDPVCMVCHAHCPGGYFWDDSVCACQPI